MMAYATICTGKTLRSLYDADWGIFITPSAYSKNRPAFRWSQQQEPPMRYAIDNGAWAAYCNEVPWESGPWLQLLEEHADGADFVVLPDIVGGGEKSLELSVSWMGVVDCHVLIPVQDGMTEEMVEPLLSERVGVFVGGTTEFKEGTLAQWASLAHRCGSWCHVGRVNSVRRINMCTNSGVDSIDGTSPVRFRVTLPMIDAARRQVSLMGDLDG